MTELIGEIQKNTLEVIRATLWEYKEKKRIDIRVYYQPDADPDNWLPIKKGINLRLDNWKEFKYLIGKIDHVISKKN